MFEIADKQYAKIGDLVALDVGMFGDEKGFGLLLGRGQDREYDELTNPCIVCVYSFNEAKNIDYYYTRIYKLILD